MLDTFMGDLFDDGVWNNTLDWDENFWSGSLQMPLGVGVGGVESNSVWGQGQGI